MNNSIVKAKKVMAITLIVLFSILLFYALLPFQGAILGALIIFTLFRPMHVYLVDKLKLRPSISSTLVIITTVFAILIPLTATILIVGNGIQNYYLENKDKLNDLNNISSVFPDFVDEDAEILNGVTLENLMADIDIKGMAGDISKNVTNFVLDAVDSVSSVVLQIAIMYFILFYLLKDMKRLTKVFYNYSPFNKRNTKRLLEEFHNMTFANIVGAGLNAVAQGFVLTLGFWMFGFPDAIFWGFIGGMLSFIPLIGPVIIWVPAGIIAILNGDLFGGIGILLWGMVVVSLVDNVVRMIVNSQIGHIHPLITLLGVFIGLPLFGILGLVLGPAILSFFLLFVKMYREEYIENNRGIPGRGTVRRVPARQNSTPVKER